MWKFKRIFVALVLVGAACGTGEALARGTVSLPPAGLTPSNFFYFLDRWGETIQEFFTFKPEARALLQLQFAAERISELQLELAAKGGDGKGLEVARQRLAGHIEKGTAILKEEERKGHDVSATAKEFDGELKDLLTAADEQESGDLTGELDKVEQELSDDFTKKQNEETAKELENLNNIGVGEKSGQ